jgi:hypothetical protein
MVEWKHQEVAGTIQGIGERHDGGIVIEEDSMSHIEQHGYYHELPQP